MPVSRSSSIGAGRDAPHHPLGPAPVVAAVLLATGCATTVAGTASPVAAPGPASTDGPARPSSTPQAAGSAETVAWVDEVCAGLLPFTEFAEQDPPIDENETDPEVLVQGLSDYLGDASAQAGSAITAIEAVGPGPARYSDELVTGMVEALTTFQNVFDDIKTDVDAIDATDPDDIITNLPTAIEPLDTLDDLPDPAKVLRADPELSAAADQAPTCQQIGGL